MTRELGARLGYYDLFGKRAEWDDLSKRVRKFRTKTIFDILGRIGVALNEGKYNDPEIQVALVKGFFGNSGVWERGQEFMRLSHLEAHSQVLFDDLQLLALAKIAVLETDDRHPDRGTMSDLGEALLMASDYTALDRSEPEYIAFVAGRFHPGHVLLNAIARAYDLYLSGNEALRGTRHFVDFRAIIEAKFELPIDKLLGLLILLVAPWLLRDLSSVATQTTLIDLKRYLPRRRFSRREIAAVFAFVGTDINSLRKDVRAEYSRERLRPYHFVPFARAPLVRFGDVVACPSIKLLADRLSEGWHHLLLTHFAHEKRAKDFFRFMGDVFENYIDRLLVRMHPVLGPAKYIGPAALEEELPESAKCDAILQEGDTLVLFESKTAQFRLEAISAESLALYKARLRKVIVEKGALQLNATIEAIKQGMLAPLGIDARQIRRFRPTVVTLDTSPMGPERYRDLHREVASRGLLSAEDIAPMEILTVADMETLELHSSLGGGSIATALARKERSALLREESMRTFLGASGSPAVGTTAKNVYLSGVFDKIEALARAAAAPVTS